MAPGEPGFESSPSYSRNPRNCYSREDGEITDVEDLKESLKEGLVDARRKITVLRREVKEKQETLEKERSMRVRAEQELASLDRPVSMEDVSVSPTLLRSRLQSPTHRTRSPAPGNADLTEKLSQAEFELEQVIQSKEDLKMELEAGVAARGAALVDKIYTAQKERDASVMARLKQLNEEKDDLLRKLKKLERDHACDSGVETGSLLGDDVYLHPDHFSLNEVVDRMTSGHQSRTIEFHGDVIVDRLHKVQDSNKRKQQEEYHLMKQERDNALKQVEQLQSELFEVQQGHGEMQNQHRKNERNRLKAIQNQLRGVIAERDEATTHCQNLQEELDQMKLQHSLKNSLSQELTLRKQFNSTLDEFEVKLNEKETQISCAQQSYDEVIAKLNNCVREKNSLNDQLNDATRQLEEERRRADKLERLVEVLRKRKNISISDTID